MAVSVYKDEHVAGLRSGLTIVTWAWAFIIGGRQAISCCLILSFSEEMLLVMKKRSERVLVPAIFFAFSEERSAKIRLRILSKEYYATRRSVFPKRSENERKLLPTFRVSLKCFQS